MALCFVVSELILFRLRHILYCLFKHGESTAHVSAKLEEFISACGELDRYDPLLLCSCGSRCCLGLHFGELFQVDAHAYVDVEGLGRSRLRSLSTRSACRKQIAQGVIHVDDLTDAKRVGPELTRNAFLLLREYLYQCVGVLDSYTHLEEILAKDLITDGEAHGLKQEELDEGEEHLGLLLVEVLVTAQLRQPLLIIRLPGQLLHDLPEEELELDRAHSVKNRHFRKHPFGTV